MSELDDLVRKRRFDEIHDARQQVIDDERSINEALATGRINDRLARRLFQRAVDAYVRELEFLLNPTGEEEESNEFWESVEIGEIRLPNGQIKVIEGLGTYLDLPEEIEVTVADYEQESYYMLGDRVERTVTVQPSWRLLRSAFRTANAAVSDLGLELQIDDEDHDKWGFREIKDIDDIDPDEWSDLSVFNKANGDA